MISMLNPVNIIVKLDQEKEAKIVSSSPIKLIVGGRARLVRLASNHHSASSGNSA